MDNLFPTSPPLPVFSLHLPLTRQRPQQAVCGGEQVNGRRPVRDESRLQAQSLQHLHLEDEKKSVRGVEFKMLVAVLLLTVLVVVVVVVPAAQARLWRSPSACRCPGSPPVD